MQHLVSNRAQAVIRVDDPHRCAAIFEERKNGASRQLDVTSEMAVFPTGKPSSDRSNPERSIARSDHTLDTGRAQLFCRHSQHPYAVESKQAEFGAEPEITVGRLRDAVDRTLGETV